MLFFLGMNYIDIKEAIKATGKSEKTIRRFLSKAESKAYINKKDNKLLINVNYLFASYPPIKSANQKGGQKLVIEPDVTIDMTVVELKNKLALYEQEIKHKDELLNERNGRIMDLQKAILLLEAPKKQEQTVNNKKRWWKF